MKTRLSVLLSVLLVLSAMGHVVFGQYAPMPSPPSLPMFANQQPMGYGAPSAVHPYAAQQGQFQPAVLAVPQLSMMPMGVGPQMPPVGPNASNGAPFRVFAAGHEESIPCTDVTPYRQVTLASTLRHDSKGGCHDGKCDQKGGKDDSCYCFRVFGDYLYLRARDAEVAYAVEANSGIGPPPIQVSPIALLDQDFSSGFRAGFGVCLDECSEFAATYTFFETATTDQIVSGPPITQIVSMVIHPATPAAVTGTAAATGRHDIDFNLIDLDYRQVWYQSCLTNVNWVAGFRYGQLEQNFASVFTDSLAPPVINEVTVLTDVDFNGGGLHLGFEGERYAARLPFMVYAKGFASLMAGEFDASYQQTVQANANLGVDTSWTAGRIVPTFDLELGAGFSCCNGSLRATAGYMFSAWTNVVKTDDFIHAVQTNDFRDMNDTMTFDGIVARVEGRF